MIGPDGRMNENAGDLAGKTQQEADEAILAWLKEHDRLEQREHYRHAVGTCERCHTRIEPLVSLQWWVAMEEPRKPALAALQERRVLFHPESQHQFAIRSLEEIPDWNISRQLWWGHQQPLWYCPDGHVTCAWPPPDACAECGSTELERDPDVLDTWFSSALWPYATLGWPERTPELERYYPGDVNSTAREIIRLWENRMIWTGLEVMGDIPFHDVIVHSTILAADGRRMSKSLGTGIDPLDLIAKHGADATRYGLLKMSSTQDVRFTEGPLEEGRKLANKLWNVSRLLLQNRVEPDARPREVEERWILARLDATRAELEQAWAAFDFSHSVQSLYRLTFDDFCDWYAEAIKPRLREGDEDAAATALAALERLLSLLHPVMPHVTEEIWSQFHETRLIVSPWPEPDERIRGRRRRPPARAGGGRDVPPQRRRRRARRRREADLRRGRPAGAGEGERECGRGDRAPPRRGRTRRADAREREVRHEREARGGRGRAREARPLPARARCPLRLSTPPGSRPSARGRRSSASGRMRALLAALGDPQLAYPAIHVVGTNGKSTATRTIEALLLAEGLSVGATVSPHVRSWAERITVDGEEVDFEAAIGRVRPEAEAQEATQFETLCAAAFAEFARRDVDVAVVEAGLGGRLDATNVLRSHVVLLTNVGLEHTDVLGETREEIAAEKLAVVQEGTIAVLPERGVRASSPGRTSSSAAPVRRPPPSSGRSIEHEVDVTLPGRLERRGDEVWDGAHNADGVRWLVARLDRDDYTVVASILARQGRARDALDACDQGTPLRRDAVAQRPRAPGRRARAPRLAPLPRGRDRARSRRCARAVGASTRPSSSPARCTFLRLWRGTRRDMTKMRERITVLAFALAVLVFIIGSAFGIGYLVGRLLL